MKKYRFHILIGLVAIVALVVAGLFLNRAEANASSQSTDDAYVRADMTVVASQVSGVIVDVAVRDNQSVKAGTPLFRIDDRELRIAVANAKAAVAGLQAQLDRQQSVIAQARTAVAATRANLGLAEQNRERFANLARDGSGTVQAQQQAEAERDVQRAVYARDQAGVRAAEQQVAILKAELDKARAELADAELRLAYTQVAAPVAGVVAQRQARVGVRSLSTPSRTGCTAASRSPNG